MDRLERFYAKLRARPFRKYRPCSGQGKYPRQWGICLVEDGSTPWWRASDSRGKPRIFSSHQAAAKAAWTMEDAEEISSVNASN